MTQPDDETATPLLAEARDAGLHRLTVPAEYGGFGYCSTPFDQSHAGA